MLAKTTSTRNTDPPAARLLDWYDRHGRVLPWRAPVGEVSDPYHVWLSEIMLQQTTVQAVKPYFARFVARWPEVGHLAAAPLDDLMQAWAGLGYYSRARNLHACARIVAEEHGGRFPATEDELRRLPGVGAYTAAAIAAIAFGQRAVVVDGNVERVVARLYAIPTPLPAAKAAIRQHCDRLTPAARPGDFAQAMMDLGATICTPRRPVCALCPIAEGCLGRAGGRPEQFPVKAPKAARPLRRGVAFVAVRTDGALLVRTRPPKGLLGGMLEVPGSEWTIEGVSDDRAAPLVADWRPLSEAVTHIFTHFALELRVLRAQIAAGTCAPEGMRWLAANAVSTAGFPTVMRKVVDVALGTGVQAARRTAARKTSIG